MMFIIGILLFLLGFAMAVAVCSICRWKNNKHDSRTFRIDRIDGGVVKTRTGEVFYL